MERAYAPLVRQFSPSKGYQTGYTLVYSLDAAAEGSCQLTLARQGAQEPRVSMMVPLDPEKGYRLQQYEIAVQPEQWDDVIADHLPALAAAPRGGTAREQ